MCEEYEIREMPLTLKSVRNKVEAFLACNGLRLENMDEYAAVFAIGEDVILAGGGLAGNTIKCVAVGDSLRGTGMGAKLISHLVCVAASKGYDHQKVFIQTRKPVGLH
jgi:citrate lyase synthetase